MNAREQGLLQKYIVKRVDGSDEPGGKHHGDEYFVLDLTTDKFALPAIAAYAAACAEEYPALAEDLRCKLAHHAIDAREFVTVPETTLPSGKVVPAFKVGKFLTSKTYGDALTIAAVGAPWVDVNYHEARAASDEALLQIITETQWLAIAHSIASQDINWTGGKVGEGAIYQGLRKNRLDRAQAANLEPEDPDERRWHALSNGERIYDFAGNAFSWVFDDVQGDADGLTTKIAADSISLTTAPFPPMEKGMGWRPDGARDWSGHALIRGGYWSSGSDAGVFHLSDDWPGYRYDGVGFRCTKPIGL